MWWTDGTNRAFIRDTFPAFLTTYDRFSYGIQRADAIRYLLLYHFGGVYADLDIECLRAVHPLLSPGCFMAGREPEEHCREAGRMLLCNAFMAAPPGHAFLLAVIEALGAKEPRIVSHADVIASTVPRFLQEVFERYPGTDVRPLDAHIVYPFKARAEELEALLGDPAAGARIRSACVERGTYAVHYWDNAWVRNLAGTLINPAPHTIDGFVFHSQVDSPGYDQGHGGRNIPELAARCQQDANVVAFNTDGFVKYRLRPRWDWDPMRKAGPNEGLYVKTGTPIPRDPVGRVRRIVTKLLRGCKRRALDTHRTLSVPFQSHAKNGHTVAFQ